MGLLESAVILRLLVSFFFVFSRAQAIIQVMQHSQTGCKRGINSYSILDMSDERTEGS